MQCENKIQSKSRIMQLIWAMAIEPVGKRSINHELVDRFDLLFCFLAYSYQDRRDSELILSRIGNYIIQFR